MRSLQMLSCLYHLINMASVLFQVICRFIKKKRGKKYNSIFFVRITLPMVLTFVEWQLPLSRIIQHI
jgi:hypothetical protein